MILFSLVILDDTADEMEISVIRFIILGVISGLTKGAGVLPAGPLNAAVGGTVMFTTTMTPTEKPFVIIGWNIDGRPIITSTNGENNTEPAYEGRITLFISTGSLELRNLALSDSGEYRVFIAPQGGFQMNGNIELTVLMPVSNVVVAANNTDLVEFKDSVRLSCSSSGSSLSFLWLNSSSEVTASDRVQLTDGNSTLTIVSVTRYDQGPFRCHVFNPVSSATSEPIHLSIYERISDASVTSSSTQPIEGKSVNLTCEAAGSVVTRKWKKGDSYVLPDHIKIYENNRVLSFQPLKKTDNGEYFCEISNPVSNDEAKYVMIVNYGPENVQIAGPSEIHLNETLTLICSAESTPAASYTWTLNGTEIHKSAVFTKVITKLSDSGQYTCEAMNIITGRTSSAVHGLTVTERIPDASVTSSSTQPIEGTSVNLTCEAAGSVVTRKWKKGDSYVLPDHIKFYDNNRVLSFQPLKKTDNGEYSCEISNPVSNDEAKYVMIVNYGPENVQITGPSEIHLKETLTLICSAESTPAASYTWTLNGTEIHNSAVFTKVITKLSDSGQYTCEARNIITERTSSAVHGLTVTEKTSSCSAGCIAGIVIACLVVCGAAAGGGYWMYKKKMAKKPIDRNTATVTGRAGQDNAAYSANQDVNYADIRFFQNKDGGKVQLGTQNDTQSPYAQVRVNSGRPAGSSPPTYDAHVQRSKRPAPQPTDTQVRKN